MATQVQLRRGNTSQTLAFTGAVAEITIDTDKETVVVHDGATAGGFALARESALTANASSITAAFNTANAAFLQANTPSYTSNSAASYANSAFLQANTPSHVANSAASYANSAFLAANTPSHVANSASSYANSAYTQANTATTNAATADAKAVTSGSYANSAYSQANTATTNAATADSKAVTAGSYANSAFTVANTKFASAGGTISGDVVVTGNLTIQGQQTYANTQTVLIADNIITVNAAINQASAPAFNAGIEVDRGSSANTSLLWNESTDKWTATNDGTNYFNLASDAAESYANSAYSQANTATTNAATADAKAVTAGSYANSSYTQANTATTNAATADAKAVTAGSYANSAFLQANTPSYVANSAASYANSAYLQANSAFIRANNSLNANTGGTVAGPIVVDNGSYGNVTITQFASVWGQASGPNAYSIVQTRSNDSASGIGMQAYAGTNGLLYANTGIQFNTSVNLRDKDYPTGGIGAGQFAANGAFIAQSGIASTSNTSGAIQVVGGVGVKGNVYADNINVTNRVDWPAVGYAPPSFTTRSAGTKLTIYPAISGSSVDYAIGINGGVLWTSVPEYTSSYSFKWYGGDIEVASISGTGQLTTATANIISATSSTSNATGALTVQGGVGVKGNVATDGVIFADGTRQTTAAVGGGASIGDVLALSIALG